MAEIFSSKMKVESIYAIYQKYFAEKNSGQKIFYRKNLPKYFLTEINRQKMFDPNIILIALLVSEIFDEKPVLQIYRYFAHYSFS